MTICLYISSYCVFSMKRKGSYRRTIVKSLTPKRLTVLITLCVAILTVLSGVLDYYVSKYDGYREGLQLEINNYLSKVENSDLLTKNKMEYHCISVGEEIHIQNTKEGLYGECGIENIHFNKTKNCLELYLYGVDLNGTMVAKEVIGLIKETPSLTLQPIEEYFPFYSYIYYINWTFLMLAFLFSSVMTVHCFKKKKDKKEKKNS